MSTKTYIVQNDDIEEIEVLCATSTQYGFQVSIEQGNDVIRLDHKGATELMQSLAHALAAPAQQPTDWREAVLDALASTGGDMPATATPAEIVRAVIDANVQIALDPRVSDAAPAQQPEHQPLPVPRKPDENGAGWFTAGQMRAYVDADRAQRFTAPSVQHRKPLTETEMYKVDNDARAQFAESQRGGPRGQQITYWDSLTPWLIRAVERAHGITAAPKDQA